MNAYTSFSQVGGPHFQQLTAQQAHALKVAKEIQKLIEDHPDGVVHLVSVDHDQLTEHRPGVVCEATIPVAAQMIMRHTHKVADDNQVQKFKADAEKRVQASRRLELERKSNSGQIAVLHPQDMPQQFAPASPPPAPFGRAAKDKNQDKD